MVLAEIVLLTIQTASQAPGKAQRCLSRDASAPGAQLDPCKQGSRAFCAGMHLVAHGAEPPEGTCKLYV